LVAYVVPLTKDGRLSAKDFLGGRLKLSAMQTDFWNNVGHQAGLDRGLEGSTAKHTTAKQYSAALARNPMLAQPTPPVPTLADRATGRARRMNEEHQVALEAHTQLVEQARAEALLGRRSREQNSRALAQLRAEFDVLQGAKDEAERLTNENRRLVLELELQKKSFAEQLAALGALLEQATAKAKQLLSQVGFWKREAEAVRAEADEFRELLRANPEPLEDVMGLRG
jgi:chromosome segregation ATPase